MAEAPKEGSEKKRVTKERGIEDYKRKIWKLKKELEEQRELALTVQKEELEKLSKAKSLEKEHALEALKLETRNDLLHMKATFNDKEAELREIVKRQEEELKIQKKQIAAHAVEVKGVREAIEGAHQEAVAKLQRELKQLKHINQELQQKYQSKQQDYRDKVTELRACQDEAEQERQKMLNDALTMKLNKVKRDQDNIGLGKDRDLQHKVTELTVTVKRLEKRCDSLKEENTILRKTETSYRDLEEHCAKLKRRNADLVSDIKSAGEKNKQLQVSNKKATEPVDGGVEHAKKLFARQRAKDFAEHAKVLMGKEREIEKLTKKNMALSDGMSNQVRCHAVNSQLDMSTALRQGTKERMSLEMNSTGRGGDDSESRALMFNMQVDYDTLRDNHDVLLEEKRKLETELEDFRSRIGEIEQELGRVGKERDKLKHECETKDQKIVKLTACNNTLTKERDHLTDTVDKLTEEIVILQQEKKESQQLMERLKEANKQLNSSLEKNDRVAIQQMESNIDSLTKRLNSSKTQLKDQSLMVTQLKTEASLSNDRIHELLDKNQSLKSQLDEINHSVLPVMQSQTDELKTKIKQLELKNDDLQEENEDLLQQQDDNDNVKLRTLSLEEELNAAKEQLEKQNQILQRTTAEHEVKVDHLSSQLEQCSEERRELEENRAEAQRRIEVLKNDFKAILITKQKEIEELSTENRKLLHSVDDSHSKRTELAAKLKLAESEISSLQAELSQEISTQTKELESFEQLNQKLNLTSSRLLEAESANKQLEVKLTECQVEEQVAKDLNLKVSLLEQENQQQLSELTKLSHALKEREQTLEDNRSAAEFLREKLASENTTFAEKIEHLQKLTEQKESEKKNLTVQISKMVRDLDTLQSTHLETSNLVNQKQKDCESIERAYNEMSAKHTSLEVSLTEHKQHLEESKRNEALAKEQLISLEKDLTQAYEQKLASLNETVDASTLAKTELESRLSVLTAQLEEESMKQISVYTGDNCYHLYVARHAYDPSLSDASLSPIKSSDRSGADSALSTEHIAGVSVNPGDYVFVSGGLTEEGFYEGHLLDGRAGLIPSNVLEPLFEFDIYGFVVASEPVEDPENSEVVVSEFSSTLFNDSNWLPSTPHPSAPYPMSLKLERQFSSGLVVGWNRPEGQVPVFNYCIYVDGKFWETLTGTAKCKALLKDVTSRQPHRVSVTATTSLGESHTNHCTIMIGEPNRPPSQLSAVAISCDTARVSFLPHNSNHHHFVTVNDEKVRTLSSSLFQVDIAGLLPLTEYTITVTASPQSHNQSLNSSSTSSKVLSTSIQFTMPSIEDLNGLSDGQIESSFLKKFDEFLEGVTHSSTHSHFDLNQIEPELEEPAFLKNYDSTLATSKPSNSAQMLHSTPKYPVKLGSASLIDDKCSPIILEFEELDGEGKQDTLTNQGQSTSESTPTIGENECTSVNENKSLKRHSGKVTVEEARNGQVSSPKSNSSALKKKSIQKMIKSLTKKEKTRVVKPDSQHHVRHESGSVSQSSNRHRHQSSEKRSRSSSQAKGALTSPVSQNQSASSTNRSVTNLRSFKAVYDYEPASMSPNKDAVNEELGFQAGDIITVCGELDEDGFYLGELNGRKGYVPSNLVEEIKNMEQRMVAQFDYNLSTRSPNKNSEEELSFRAGDTVIVIGRADGDGFYRGFIEGKKGKQGLIPSNYLQTPSPT